MMERFRAVARHWLEQAARARPGPRLRNRLALVSVVVFVGASFVAWFHMPASDLRPGWLAVVATLAGLAVGINVVEVRLTGRLADQQIGWRRCLRIVLWGSATNLMPFPGSFLVRTQAVAGERIGWGGSVRATLAPGIAWLICASLVSGGALLQLGSPLVAVLLLTGGGVALVGLWGLLPVDHRGPRWMGRLLVLEAVFVVLSAGRLLAALAALGIAAAPTQALVLGAASAWAAAAGIFPGGLGLSELLAGGLGALAGISAASGVLAAAVSRVVGLSVLGGLSAFAWLLSRRRHDPPIAA